MGIDKSQMNTAALDRYEYDVNVKERFMKKPQPKRHVKKIGHTFWTIVLSERCGN